ncbi:TniQ family protein [Psychrobacillus glaciei]|uniref:TniQ family protein n=1 Tax=Psychrobacillus glaciei TaxID=2283160 RepID=UPI001CEF9374|nr:TniQ family protein [Psychrobacillus glaciei]
MLTIQASRSILYNIDPIGIETGLVESLCSYLIRLSYEHNLNVGHLVNKLVVPELHKDYLERSSKYGGNSFFEGAKTINGYKDNSTELVRVLEELTTRIDLANLTLFKLKDLVPLRNLFKETFSWCPECIKNWNDNNKSIYYPLIWYLKPVQICFKHKCYLIDKCPACYKKTDILRRQMIPGHCPNCFNLLIQDEAIEEINNLEWQWHTFVYLNIESLIGLNSSKLFVKENISKQLNYINQDLFSDNIPNFARFLGIPKSTLRAWIKSENIPTLDGLLMVCFKLDTTILEFFSKNLPNVTISHLVEKTKTSKEKVIRRRLDFVSIENSLNEVLICDQPISMVATAKIIGRDKRVLYSNFPEYCKQISKRYREYINLESKQRIEELKKEIQIAFYSLVNEGIYPSSEKIQMKTNKRGLLKERVLQEYWRDLLVMNSLYNGKGRK